MTDDSMDFLEQQMVSVEAEESAPGSTLFCQWFAGCIKHATWAIKLETGKSYYCNTHINMMREVNLRVNFVMRFYRL